MKKSILFTCLVGWVFFLSGQAKYCGHSSFYDASLQAADSESTLDVRKVTLDLRLDNLSTQLSGVATLEVEVIASTSQFDLELVNELQVSDTKIDGEMVNHSHQNDLLTITSDQPINPGAVITLEISYSGEPNPGEGIFSGINNASSNAWGNQITWTLSEPFNAKSWWPSRQVLSDKIDETIIKITVPNHLMAGSNGLLTEVNQLGNGQVQYVWETQYTMAYYLLAITVGEYVTYNTYAHPSQLAGDSILIQNFIYNNPATLPYFKSELDGIDDMMVLFSDLYGLYPFHEEKYGHIMAPFSGGMEHQTLSSMGFFTFGLNAHELAHQWYGNLTTCGRWNDIWINEGFARFSEYIAAEKLLSNKDAQAAIINDQLSVTGLDTGSVFIPLDQKLTDSRIFSFRLTYQKGGLILHMLRHVVNDDELFFEVMRAFSGRFRDQTAIGDDFLQVLEEVTEQDYSDFFEQWYYGEGHPEFDITYLLKNDSIYFDVRQATTDNIKLFTTPLEFEIAYESGNIKLVRLSQSQNEESFALPAFGTVKRVRFDPENYLIKKVNAFNQIDENGNIILSTGEQESITFYPNPAKQQIRFSAPVSKVSIVNMSGVEVLSQSSQRLFSILDIKKLPSGLYLISTDGGSFKRLVIK